MMFMSKCPLMHVAKDEKVRLGQVRLGKGGLG